MAVRNAKPREGEYKLADSGGLYLLVTPSGGRLWRLKYRMSGVERKLALGRYPEVTLVAARKARDAAREAASAGNDPAAARRRDRILAKMAAGTTFAAVAEEYIAKAEREGRSEATLIKLRWAGRAWLLDPVETQVAASVAPRSTGGKREDWNGEYYVSFGHSGSRSWAEARRYNFVCAGGGSWYSGTLRLLKQGDRIWVKAPGYGFVGVGRVRGGPIRAAEFTLPGPDGRDLPAMSVLVEGTYHREFIDDPDRSEYFVPVDWLDTVPLENAVDEVGLFGNQNTVCAPKTPKWRHTVERLKLAFPGWDR